MRRSIFVGHRMTETFHAAIIFLLFLLLNMASTRDNMLSSLKLNSALTCRLVGGLTREQRTVCHEAPDTAAVAFEGLQLAVKECQHQFRWHRWNCSSLSLKSSNPHSSAIMKRGFRESSFLYALTAAGVAHAISRACAQGRLLSCGCDSVGYKNSHDRRTRVNKWEWSGCSHNLGFGIEFSKKFLDVREKVDDLQSKINVHNNDAGRSILSSHMEVRCKCHGLSGSCQLRTCWKATPDFRVVASTIKRQYRKALVVAQEGQMNNGMSVLKGRPRGKRKSKPRPAPKTSLLFFERSPNFCEVDPRMDSAGTSGRVCRMGRPSRSGACELLCCGRGHSLVRKSSVKPCNCTFHWCCTVNCQRCRDDKWIAVCK